MTISETDCLTGYVLHTRKFQETSLLVEFFSRDEGRGSLLVKGIRRQQKKQLSSRAELHLFRKLSVQLYLLHVYSNKLDQHSNL